jgi:hypothetical protein
MKASDRFYWHEIMMKFIEGKLFHDKRRNLTVYEQLSVDFNITLLCGRLLKGISSTIREGT